jgi:uncharacterized protein YbcV (DUF1398 family)
MEDRLIKIAETCLHGAEQHTMTFPQIVGALRKEGFESYFIDFRRTKAVYYLPDGESVELGTRRLNVPVAKSLDPGAVQAAIREAQQLAPGYTYEGFCRKVMEAGCAGYIVSFSGRRAVYYGRTAEMHVEHFPQ